MRIVQRSPKTLIPYPDNPRVTAPAVQACAASIKDFGFNQPIVVDRHDVIIVGHTRREAAILLNLRQVPVLRKTDLSAAKAKAYRLADNRTGENSFWIEEKLAAELASLSPKQRKSTGFTGAEIEDLIGAIDEAVPVKARVEFSQELLESRNYVVLYFDNDIDWLSAKTHFGLRSVYSKRANGKPWNSGTGRVVDGAKYLRRITKDG